MAGGTGSTNVVAHAVTGSSHWRCRRELCEGKMVGLKTKRKKRCQLFWSHTLLLQLRGAGLKGHTLDAFKSCIFSICKSHLSHTTSISRTKVNHHFTLPAFFTSTSRRRRPYSHKGCIPYKEDRVTVAVGEYSATIQPGIKPQPPTT